MLKAKKPLYSPHAYLSKAGHLRCMQARLFEHDVNICSSTNWLAWKQKLKPKALSCLIKDLNLSGSPTQGHASKLKTTHKVCIEFAKVGLGA